jgi:hypothetical protein
MTSVSPSTLICDFFGEVIHLSRNATLLQYTTFPIMSASLMEGLHLYCPEKLSRFDGTIMNQKKSICSAVDVGIVGYVFHGSEFLVCFKVSFIPAPLLMASINS